MKIELKPNAVNQIAKGTMLFEEGEVFSYICLVLKGKVVVFNDGLKTVLPSGSFLGSNEFSIGKYLNNYVAQDDVLLYAFDVQGMESLEPLLSINKDYNGLMVFYLCNYLRELRSIKDSFYSCADSLYEYVMTDYKSYLDLAQSNHIQEKKIPMIDKLEEYKSEIEIDDQILDYYTECAVIPLDVQKTFYAAGSSQIVLYNVEKISELIYKLTQESKALTVYIHDMFSVVINEGELNLFYLEARLAIQMKKNKQESGKLIKLIEECIDRINQVETLFNKRSGHSLVINRERMEQVYYAILSGESVAVEQKREKNKDIESEVVSLTNSLQQIIKFANFKQEKATLVQTCIEQFIKKEDRFDTSTDMRNLRKQIAEIFYELYEVVFVYAYHQEMIPRAVELFLNFGYIDERLLTKEQLYELCKIEYEESEDPCNVYTIREWLTLIYENKKEPSKNEFDVDYISYIRELKKQGKVTETEEKDWLEDKDKKLQFEIQNMFTLNHKIVNGQISSFVPILYKEMLSSGIERMARTKATINRNFERLLELDYSIFHREILYVNNEVGIEKEYIMKQVFPDIIILPTSGITGSMWQEITGKKRDTKGRFMLPAFMDANLNDVMIKLFGRFRWEMCRSIQGGAWNNMKYKSLTSEYMDYIQFYRKNSDLSSEKKERIKSQIQKARNNSREAFVIDYEAWLKEASGAIKLNKVAREIVATYCPFPKEIRTKLNAQPIFEEAMGRFHRNIAKKVYELELRYRALRNENVEITPELIETMNFYKEL